MVRTVGDYALCVAQKVTAGARTDTLSQYRSNSLKNRGFGTFLVLMHTTHTSSPRWAQTGILSGNIDDVRRRHPSSYPEVEAIDGLDVVHNGTGQRGVVVGFRRDAVTLRLASGGSVTKRLVAGGFRVDGRNVSLIAPRPTPRLVAPLTTASGSIVVPGAKAKVAKASRIWVEGKHDAELIEKVWGDDLRHVGIVVEPMHGMNDLGSEVAEFGPAPHRRLGILLDHLVSGTKEERVARQIRGTNVLVLGHPFVDVWEAVKPQVAGINAWPRVPLGQDWKTGVCAALGYQDHPGRFWSMLLGRVNQFTDLDVSLINAVERLIDFVTECADEKGD